MFEPFFVVSLTTHSEPYNGRAIHAELANGYGAWRLRDLRALLERAPAQQLTFLEKHPLIRDLEAYGNIVPVCFAPSTSNHKPSTEPIE
jgi:hypothetical protein